MTNSRTTHSQLTNSRADVPVGASWDSELTPAMEALGVVLHEEAVLDLLLEDLRQ